MNWRATLDILFFVCILMGTATVTTLGAEEIHNNTAMRIWQSELARLQEAELARTYTDVLPEEDAAGAVDGNTSNLFSFHTNEDDVPFWQVDLGQIRSVNQVVVHNNHIPQRAGGLQVLLSDDATEWRTAFELAKEPTTAIEAFFEPERARYVRLQLPSRGYFHLTEVEVFGPDDATNYALHQPATQSSVSPWSIRSITLLRDPVVIKDGANRVLDPLFAALENAGVVTDTLRENQRTLAEEDVPADDPRWADVYARTWKAASAEAAKQLRQHDIEELAFVRRQTLNAYHVYTEHDEGDFRPGGGLCILDLKSGAVREIVPELTQGGVVNRFDLSFDGRRIVFDFKASRDEGYRIYEAQIDGSRLRPLTHPDANVSRRTDDMQPCYLPSGDIVFVTTRPQYSVLCDPGAYLTVANLWRMDANGERMWPLTNSPLNEQSPALLPDGRILYKRWEYVDKAAGNVKGLWAMRPDGSGSVEIYGNEIAFPETMIYGRPIPGAPNRVVFLGASHVSTTALGTVLTVDLNDNPREPDTMHFVTDDIHALAHSGFHFRNDSGDWVHDETGLMGRLFKDPYPIHDDLFIVAYKPPGVHWADSAGYELRLLDSDGNTLPLYRDDAYSTWHPYPLRPRMKPEEPATPRNERLAEENMAQVLVTDVYEGLANVPRGEIKYIRILEQIGRPWSARKSWSDDGVGHAHSAVGNGNLSVKVQHGVVPVEPDGSSHFLVPAMRNIYFQALDEHYRSIRTQRTYINYMGGEMRSCVGCHAERTLAPTALPMPLAAMEEPKLPMAQATESTPRKVFDYERQIQPIWNRHCVECHNVEQPSGNLNLEGTPQGVYSVSYEHLLARSSSNQLLGFRAPRNEDAASLEQDAIQSLPPYALGSPTSTLVAFLTPDTGPMKDESLEEYAEYLRQKHPDVKLNPIETLQIINWIDVNAPYHPSYWGRFHEQYQQHPNYRPAISFEEARMRDVPPKVRRAEEDALTD